MPTSLSQSLRLDDIAHAVAGKLFGSGDTTVTGLSSLVEAGHGDLVYVATDRLLKDALASQASAFVVHRHIPELKRPQIVVSHPAYAFTCIAQRFFLADYRARGISDQVSRGERVEIGAEVSIWPFVTLANGATIGARATLFPGVFIGENAVVGDNSILYPNVTIREGCVIGSRVVIHSGTVIGSDGFGYVQHEGRHHKIPQLGIVVIEDDVELGSNVTVDRATFGRTLIKRGSKVDNLVQIAHNVTIGEDCILAAQVGIAGSTHLGHYIMVGGQAGISDHLEVGDRVMIAARSGVNRSLSPNQIVSGAPAMPHEISIKAQAVIPRLPELRQQLRALEERMRTLEGKSKKAKDKRQK